MLEAQKSGKGQVVDAAMVDGAASLMTAIYGIHGSGIWNDNRGDNILDTGAHYYDVYETKDGKYVRSDRSKQSSTTNCCGCRA